MPTDVEFYTEPINIDYLMTITRPLFGDLTGDIYSDTIIRTSLVNAVQFLQSRWLSKYQIYRDDIMLSPQPANVPSGYVAINSVNGIAYIPSGLIRGDVFRNPYVVFDQESPPIIEQKDEMAIALASVYLLRLTQISSSSSSLVSWATEDIRYSNLGMERSQTKLLTDAKDALDSYFMTKLAPPKKSTFSIISLGALDTI